MKKVLGIIAEYNPFHNGHLYHLNKSKQLTNADYTIAIISGNFTQRGDTSIINKWDKTEAILENGVDLVIELPLVYSISSAENFADGAIKILDSLGVVDYVSFGCETTDIDCLNNISNTLFNEPEEYKKILNQELSNGISYPKARQIAIEKYLNISSDALSMPNNILAIEYLKALKKYKSSISPIFIKRIDNGYNDTEYKNNIASATAIRNIIKENRIDELKNLVPNNSYSILYNAIKQNATVIDLSCFEKEIIYTLRKMSVDEISNLSDVSEGLEFSIKRATNSCSNLNDLLNSIKSKRYTKTRLQRILLYSLLDITKKDIELSKKVLPYIRVLGFNDNGKELISEIAKNEPNLEIITSLKKFIDTNNDNALKTLIDKDILATNIYTLGYKSPLLANLDFTKKIIKK